MRIAALVLFVGICAMPGIASATCPLTATSDFDGSCKSDILWLNNRSSAVDIWFMNGTVTSGSGSPTSPGTGYSIVGVGDFNGDGKADVLWQNTSNGSLFIWLMNGATIVSSGSPGGEPVTAWSVQGVGDFNGDGKADILWQNATTGEAVIWFMNGTSVTSSLNVAAMPGWTVVGIGDFNGDGKSDILWLNQSTGANVIWLMSGTGISSQGNPGGPGAPWNVVGVGDFNGDGKADILWQDTASGQLDIWLMNGTSVSSIDVVGNPSLPGSPWSVQQVGDFDGDGMADILFYNNQTSEVLIWLMHGATVASSGSPGTPGLTWQVSTPPPYGVPAPAKQVGYAANTFNSTYLGNSAGNLYWPANFYSYPGGTAVQNGDGSFTISNGSNDPQVATAQYVSGSTPANHWTGTCFSGGGYFDVYASWPAFDSSGHSSWPSGGLYDVVTSANGVGAAYGNQWTQAITASAAPVHNATSIGIPPWAGTITVSAQVKFSDGETKTVSFSPGATSISWSGGLTGSSFTTALSVLFGTGTNYGNWPELDVFEQDTGSTTSVSIDGFYDWYGTFGSSPSSTRTVFNPVTKITTSMPHHYSVLWVPATSSAQGSAKWYLDGTLVNTATWNQYSANNPPAPTGSMMMGTTNYWTGGNAFSVIDSRCMMYIWDTAPSSSAPMTVYSFSVWQASGASNQTQ